MSAQNMMVVPPVTMPLSREFVGFAVINVSFAHLLLEPGDASQAAPGYLREGSIVRVVERRGPLASGESPWVLVESIEGKEVGWLPESDVSVYESVAKAQTAAAIKRR